MRQGRDLKLRNPIRGRKQLAAVSLCHVLCLFEIKKPHKGTETISVVPHDNVPGLFEIKKPHKGTETIEKNCIIILLGNYLKLRNPIRGRKQFQRLPCYTLHLI